MPSILKKISIIALLIMGACTHENDSIQSLDNTLPGDKNPEKEAVASSMEIAFMAQRRRISTVEAATRLEWQRKAPLLGQKAAALLREDFGGVWIDVFDNDRIKLAVVQRDGIEGARRDNPHADISKIVDELKLGDAADIVEVMRSFSELRAANDRIGDAISAIGPSNRIIAGVKTDLNAVRIGIPRGETLTEAEQKLVDMAMDEYGDGVIVDEYTGRIETQEGCVYPYCDPELRGGNRIHNSGRFCTSAFVAQSKVDDRMFQLTAGHCVVDGFNDTWYTKFTDGSSQNIGTVQDYIFGEAGDMAIIRVNDVALWDPENWVHVTASTETTENQQYYIYAEGYATVGKQLCVTGSALGRSDCGTVTELDVTVTFSNNRVAYPR